MEHWIARKVSLALIMRRGFIKDLTAVKLYLARCTDEMGIDYPESNGVSPLMVACSKGWKDIVSFLLESGADPNLKCFKGNTPLHYTCGGDETTLKLCRVYKHIPTDEFQTRFEIVRQLLRHGARIELNGEGLSAPCLAALKSFKDVVEFFVSDDSGINMSAQEKVTAFELLGMSQALYDQDHLNDAKDSFEKAASLSLQYSNDIPPREVHSSLPKCFSDAELSAQSSSEGLTTLQLKMKAFLAGERNLPEDCKEQFLWSDLANFAAGALCQPETSEVGMQSCLYLLELEMESKCDLGTVLERIKDVSEPYCLNRPGTCFISNINDLLQKYLQGFKTIDNACFRKNGNDLLESLGYLIFNLTYYTPAKCHLQPILSSVEEMANLILQSFSTDHDADEVNYTCTSITQVYFDLMLEAMWGDALGGQSKQTRNRLQLVMSRLLRIDSNLADEELTLSRFMDLDYIVRDLEFKLSLIRLFVRYNCFSSAEMEAAKDVFIEYHVIDEDEEATDFAEIVSLLSPPTSPLSLEELAVRTVFRHRISYQKELPVTLVRTIEGKQFQQSDLDTPPEDSHE